MSKIITYANLQTFKRKNDEKNAADIAAAKAALIGADGDSVAADTIRAAKRQASGALSAANNAYIFATSKYAKPADGIPKSDLSLGVQAALDKASVSIQEHQKIATGSSKGTISVDGKDVAVNGLGNMAYKDSVSKSDVGLGSVVNAGQDSTPTASSNNYVTSGGVKSYVDAAIGSVKQFQYEVVTDIDLTGYIKSIYSQAASEYEASGIVTEISKSGSSLIYYTKSLETNSPTASGNALAFIDSISQNKYGQITATKKTVSSASTASAGLMSAADKTKLDGITEATDEEIEALFS